MIKTIRIVASTSRELTFNFRNIHELRKAVDAIGKSVDERADLIDSLTQALASSPRSIKLNLDVDNPDKAPSPTKKSTDKLDFKKITAVDAKKIDKNFQIISTLLDKQEKLKKIEDYADANFSSDAMYKKTKKEIGDWSKKINKELQDAYAVVKKIVKVNIPSKLSSDVKDLFDRVLETYDGWYDESDRKALLDMKQMGKDYVIRYTFYLRLGGLLDDFGETLRPDMYVIITAEMDYEGNVNYAANTLPNFRTAGKFNPGQQVRDMYEAEDVIYDLLIAENYGGVLKDTPFPLGADDIGKSNFAHMKAVTGVDLDDDKLTLTIKGLKTEDQVNEVLKQAIVIVNGALFGKAKGHLKYTVTKARGGHKLTFIFVDADEVPNVLQKPQLKKLQEGLGLTNQQVKKIQQVINYGY